VIFVSETYLSIIFIYLPNRSIINFTPNMEDKIAFLEKYKHCAETGALKKIWFAKQTNATELNLSNKKVSDLMPLKDLTQLQHIDVSYTEVNDLTPLKDLTPLQNLYVSQTEVSDLTPLKDLTQLQNLYISQTEVSDLTPLKALTQLRKLRVYNTQVSDLKPLKTLTQLQQLDVHETQVNDLTPLKALTQLQQLRVYNTQVSDLTSLKALTQLQKLDISETHVSDLTPLKALTQLQQLNISETRVSDLTPLKALTQLQLLDVSETRVSDLTPLKYLPKLLSINVKLTQVSDLTPLKYLPKLRSINVKLTQVSDLTPLKYLTQLQKLDVSSTQVSDLTPLKNIIENGIVVKWAKYDIGIVVQDCPLINPPKEIVQQGIQAILRYWAEQERVGKQKVNEARLLLVGQGESGKTTLKEKLRDRNAAMPESDATTLGIDIETLKCQNTEGDDFTVQVWDFGGQNIQKFAHQFFMSDSVVYAVLSNTRGQNPNFQYWLNIIELLGKDSPFFIVQNEKDGHAEQLKDITQIQERFPHTFQSVEQVNLKNAATDPRFDILEKRLFYAATQLPHTQKEYLTSFINVRRKLEDLAKTKQSILFSEFKQLCKDEGIEDVELMNDYARTFTLLGIALHFSDDVQLKSQVFLRPKWIIDALFALLYAPSVEAQNGRFSTNDVEKIWIEADYEDMHGVLLQLMVRFHLCYALPNTTGYIVPQRLPTRQEPFVPPTDATHILYRYKFLPNGILTQLTCRLHGRIEGEKVWNDAVQFIAKNGEGWVFARENSTANSIELFAFGQHKADLINTVVDTLDDIHQNSKFGNLKYEKLVPCPCPVCATTRAKQEEAEFFDYNFLIELLRDGETESDRCRLSKKKFPIKTILKASSIRTVKIEQIKDLLSADKIEDALKILRGLYNDTDEVIIQLSRLTHNSRESRMGQLGKAESLVERNRIVKDVVAMLSEWEEGE
jgi:internalin A